MTHALAVNKQVFGVVVGDLTKVFSSYANNLTDIYQKIQNFKQQDLSVEEYSIEFGNLIIN